MTRNLIGSLLALLGAAAAVWSPFRSWYDGRHGQDFRLGELFTPDGISGADAGLWGGLFLPMAVAALLTLIGLVLRSLLLVAFSGILVLGFTILWMVRQGQAAGSLTAGGDSGLGAGVALALAGGVVILLGSSVMRGRRKRRGRHRVPSDAEQREREGRSWGPGVAGTGTAAAAGTAAATRTRAGTDGTDDTDDTDDGFTEERRHRPGTPTPGTAPAQPRDAGREGGAHVEPRPGTDPGADPEAEKKEPLPMRLLHRVQHKGPGSDHPERPDSQRPGHDHRDAA